MKIEPTLNVILGIQDYLYHKHSAKKELANGELKTSSLNKFNEKFKDRISTSYIISPKAFKIENNIFYLPCYMTFCL